MASISGLALSRAFFFDAVKGILTRHFPGLKYAAALLGDGSEVLGLDDDISRDHHWGPRLQVFLEKSEHAAASGRARAILASELPLEFMGYPTNWTEPNDHHVQLLAAATGHPVNHRVEFHTVEGYMKEKLGLDGLELSAAEWATIPEQALLEFTAGEVFHDASGLLTRARQALAYYPERVWRALLASEWSMIAEEGAFVGRAGQRGDELGSAIVASRQVKRLMRVAFLLARRYAPYPKWFGTAFKRLPTSERLGPILHQVVGAVDWREREGTLVDACILLVEEMTANGIIPPVRLERGKYYGRDQVDVDLGPVIANLSKDVDESLFKIVNMGSTTQIIDDSRQFKVRDREIANAMKRLYSQ
ncbi:MAG: DUF4037 domain-containing protein [Candidatus Lokiarchaeota archaeon]|nr:DUF4037 domain-containing protein [Candidatus Lokiarchaeota archaeon]